MRAGRELLDALPSGAALLDGAGRVLYANRAFARLLGRGTAALKGRPLERHVAPAAREDFRGFLRAGRAGRTLDLPFLRRSGGLRPLRLTVAFVRRKTLGLGAEDLEPQRRLEEQVSASRVTRAIFQEAWEAIVVCDAEGRILRVSRAAWTLAGGNPLGRFFDEAFPLSVSESGLPAQLFSLLRLGSSSRWEATMPGPDGFLKHLSVGAKPVRLGRPRPPGHVVIMSDIGETKRLHALLEAANASLQRRVEERTAGLRLLYDLACASNQAGSVEEALRTCLEHIGRHGRWKRGRAWLGARLRLEAEWRADGLPAPRDAGLPLDLSRRALRSGSVEVARSGGVAAAVPIRKGGEVLGVLEFSGPAAVEPEPSVLDAAGLHLGEVVDRKRLQREFIKAVADEHERIRRELHDGVGQELTGLSLMTKALREQGGRDSAEEVARGIQRVLREVRDLSHGVFPAELSGLGLSGALRRLAEDVRKRSGFRCTFRDAGVPATPGSEATLQIYRIAQEAVSNAMRHSGGACISMSLERDGEGFCLDVQDDGRGLSRKRGADGSGLRIMRFRAEAIGATLQVRREPGGGTRVRCRWKAPASAPARPDADQVREHCP